MSLLLISRHVSPPRGCVNDQFPIFRTPFWHLSIGLDSRTDVVDNSILLLTGFVVKRNRVGYQRPKSPLDIGLVATGDAYAKRRFGRCNGTRPSMRSRTSSCGNGATEKVTTHKE